MKMVFNLSKLARINEFSMELDSFGRLIFISLNTNHLSQADKKLACSDVQSLDFVRWLFGEMGRQPVDGLSEEHDPANNPRLAAEKLTLVTNEELEEFADKLIQKNKHHLLKTHQGRDIERSLKESACDFIVRAFHHHATEEKAQWKRMVRPVFNSVFASTTAEAIQRNLGVSDHLQNTIEKYTHGYVVTEAERILAIEKDKREHLTKSVYNSLFASTTAEAIQRNLGIADQHVATAKIIALSSQSRNWAEYSDWNRIDRFSTTSEIFGAQVATQQHLAMYSPAAVNEVKSIAELAQTYTLQAALDPFRTAVEPFASKLLHLQTLDNIRSPAYLNAFIQASTISDIFVQSIRVDHQLQEAMRQFAHAPIPTFDTLNGYRQFLDAAGLGLSHWPHPRLLTIGEKRRRFRVRLTKNTESSHVKKARTVAQRYELTLREILDEVMASVYGENWALERLPLCNCKDLLGKWQKRGGEVLDHADYTHYERIMSYPAHFEAVFETGFDDMTALAVLINKAGKLRAALQHFHPFTSEDLRDLRLIWRTIETGLLALTDDYDFESE